jgi:hypothetical protein
MANGWLHKGSLVCPACSDVCGADYECRTGILPPKNYVYYEDYLVCGSARCWLAWTLLVAAMAVAAVVR